MIEFLLALLSESPLLFVILMANLAIMAYIIFRISMYLIHQNKPGQALSHFVWKIKTKKSKEEIETMEGVYAFVMEGMRKEGLLEKEQEIGFRTRQKLLPKLQEGKKRDFVENLFELYEAKLYGNRRIKDEKNLVAGILDDYFKL
jgi:hypothetical protein